MAIQKWLSPGGVNSQLLRACQASKAAQVYPEDLQRYPENGWALMGLCDALQRQGKALEASSVDARLKRAWARANVKPPSTCYCQARSF